MTVRWMEMAIKEITRMHTQKEVVEAWLGGLPCESRGTITDGRTLWSKDETDDMALEAPALGTTNKAGVRVSRGEIMEGRLWLFPREVWGRRYKLMVRHMRAQADCAGGEAVRKTRGSE